MDAAREFIKARQGLKAALIESVVSKYLGDDVVAEIKEAKAFTPVAQGVMAMNRLEFLNVHHWSGSEWLQVLIGGEIAETVQLQPPFEGFAP